MSTKLILQAIRNLPEDWIDDETDIVTNGQSVLVAHPNKSSMIYDNNDKNWRKIVTLSPLEFIKSLSKFH